VTVKEPARIPLKDVDTDRAVDELRQAHASVAAEPLLKARTFEVDLVDTVTAKIPHKLGRKFTNYFLGAPQGPSSSGRIEEVTGADTSKEVWLKATGFGATITVRITVF